jgi:hypothetical protein
VWSGATFEMLTVIKDQAAVGGDHGPRTAGVAWMDGWKGGRMSG